MSIEGVPHDITEGQIYEDARTGDELQLLYIDAGVYLLRDRTGHHRIGERHEFDRNVKSGRFSLAPDPEPFETPQHSGDEKIAFEELDAIGESGAENLREKGIVTRADVIDSTDEEILDTGWVGDKGLRSIREEVQ
jgi:hypothetical protein